MGPSRRWSTLVVPLLLAVAAPLHAAEQRLVLVGGGTRPPEAMRRFVEWAGGPQARVLVVLWASEEPKESYASLQRDLAAAGASAVEAAPLAPVEGEARTKALAQIRSAAGVFFCGGDQVRIMAVLEDAELREAMRERYRAGAVFGGTSAGLAIMSEPMITGEGDFTVLDGSKVEVKPGLGLLPGTIVDQHFVRRQRENRLFGLILDRPELLGVGVDEDTAALVVDGKDLEVAGKGTVMIVDGRAGRAQLLLTILRPGERFDLGGRKRP